MPESKHTNRCTRMLLRTGILTVSLVLAGQWVWSQSDSRRHRGIGARTAPSTEARVALVLGNSNYTRPGLALTNPVNDANDISAKLRQLGFTVTTQVDLSKRAIEEQFRQLPGLLDNSRVFLFYYAGHGVQVDGQNYLIPIDASIHKTEDIKTQAVDLRLLLSQLRGSNPTLPEKGDRLNIVILDACRNNPFKIDEPLMRDLARTRSSEDPTQSSGKTRQGLASVDVKQLTNTLIAYSTGTDSLASDGSGRNGLYTSTLLAEMDQEGRGILEVFRKVRGVVEKRSNGEQVPWELISLKEDFYFVGTGPDRQPSPANSQESRVGVESEGRWTVVTERSLDMRADQPLLDTGLALEPGMSLKIKVGSAGKIHLGNNVYAGPAGVSNPDPQKPVSTCPTGAIFARIGPSYLCVRSEFDGRVETFGPLLLGTNESKVADNVGSYSVKILIQKFQRN